MRRVIRLVLICMLLGGSAAADQRLIVRNTAGQTALNLTCQLLGCTVIRGLGDPMAQVFLIGVSDLTDLNEFIRRLSLVSGVEDVEIDRLLNLLQNTPPIPQALYDPTLVSYYGVDVRQGYTAQPAVQIVRISEAQNTFGVSGTGTVAVIDTGVDPNHPVLRPVLVPGYDFTRNTQGTASEDADINQSTVAVVDGVPPNYVNNYAAAVVDQSTVAVVDNSQYFAFGHGTMVSGIIHLVAPRAMIMPLKTFTANGSGYTSDILRAVYWATRYGARVINMSFSLPQSSTELKRALDFATGSGAICVASAGNQGSATILYPAGYDNVIGVASTTNDDVRSIFSNYGSSLVWLAAPGEGVITTYPFGTYAAAWGTSFSAPFVSGTVGLLLQMRSNITQSEAASAVAHAKILSSDLGHGRLDIVGAIQAIGMQ
jgi:subtilisin family serine protease